MHGDGDEEIKVSCTGQVSYQMSLWGQVDARGGGRTLKLNPSSSAEGIGLNLWLGNDEWWPNKTGGTVYNYQGAEQLHVIRAKYVQTQNQIKSGSANASGTITIK